MKVTKAQLKRLIKEELEAVLDEKFTMPDQAKDITRGMGNKPDLERTCNSLKSELGGLDPHARAGDHDANRAMVGSMRDFAEGEWVRLKCAEVLGTAAE